MGRCWHTRGNENPPPGSDHTAMVLEMGGADKDTSEETASPELEGGGSSARVGVLAVQTEMVSCMDILVLYRGKLNMYKSRDKCQTPFLPRGTCQPASDTVHPRPAPFHHTHPALTELFQTRLYHLIHKYLRTSSYRFFKYLYF